jgi:putative protease
MELLAPVGSKESFVTAIRGGANAVYVGVPDFNARIAAANINLYDLQVMIAHAHEKKVKVFLALNTLIKHEEISDAVKSISYVAQLNPDAVIVQDLGIASIIRKYYPELHLHASTQLAVHNRMGVDFLARQGFQRVIMARELSFSELKIVVKGSPIPIEIFCHGALCFSLSGMCLFSSFIGGMSGNRGRCTQPCRRLWQNGGKDGYIFSPRDMEFAEHINKLKKIGVASLKIEGRMRSSEYVYKTVTAYRMLIDASDADFPAALKEAKTILAGDAAREKTTCLFSGRDANIFQPKKAQCLGNLVGSIDAIKNGSLYIRTVDDTVAIVEGDRLRLSNPATDTTIAFKVKEISTDGGRYVIPFGKTEGFSRGNPVFKTIDTMLDQKDIEKDIDAVYQNFQSNNRGRRIEPQTDQAYTALISNKWKELKTAAPVAAGEEALWVRFDDIGWLDVLPPPEKNGRYIFYLTKENLHLSEKIPVANAARFAGELPPFIGQREIPLFQQCIDKMVAMGVTKWVINNVSQFEYFKGTACELSAGHFLYTWNAYTAAFLAANGIKYFTASWEDDFLNVRKLCGPGLGKYVVAYLYGYVPVVRSRIITREMLNDDPIRDRAPASELQESVTPVSFTPVFESELAVLIPEKPVSIFTARRKFKECGIANFGIDLCFISPDRKRWTTLLTAYQQQENPMDSLKFNFKRGVK